MKLFVYGIFLGYPRRREYQMSNSRYDTLVGWKTTCEMFQGRLAYGGTVVEAEPGAPTDVLTGLTVDVPEHQWERLDRLEGGYQRIIITTTSGTRAFMYAKKD